jgi:L-threonylcarbamoyladenylate synthase
MVAAHPIGPHDIQAAANAIKQGELVAFPTETVYGLGADATNPEALWKVFEVKQRPLTDPLIVHVDSLEMADEVGELGEDDSVAHRLAERFWPGPLTLIVPRHDHIPDLVGGGRQTVGLRQPNHPVARDLLGAAGVPVAAPSANRFGRISPTTAAHVRAELGLEVRLVLDAGPTPLGIESTVVDCTTPTPTVLRPGVVGSEEIKSALGMDVVENATVTPDGVSAASPGTLSSHYSPRTPLVVLNIQLSDLAEVVARLADKGVDAAALEQPHDLSAAAAALYARMRELDDSGAALIVASAVESKGVGRAINDRLMRAAHGHLVHVLSDESLMGMVARVR